MKKVLDLNQIGHQMINHVQSFDRRNKNAEGGKRHEKISAMLMPFFLYR